MGAGGSSLHVSNGPVRLWSRKKGKGQQHKIESRVQGKT